MDRKLKNYKIYLKRLKLFARANKVSIVIAESDSEGVWMPLVRRIRLDENLSNSVEIASLLHELGHSIDDLMWVKLAESKEVDKAYEAMYSEKVSSKQRKIVVEFEERAWKNARNIAKRLNIRLGKWYYKTEKKFLNTYKKE